MELSHKLMEFMCLLTLRTNQSQVDLDSQVFLPYNCAEKDRAERLYPSCQTLRFPPWKRGALPSHRPLGRVFDLGITRGEERILNEKHIQQVLEIEKKAQEVQEQAQREAQELPRVAEQEAQALIAKAKAEAEEEARRLLAEAQAEDKANEVLAEVERQGSELEAKANANLDKAVAYVLERVIGRA